MNKPEHYSASNFIKQVRDGEIEFDYRGQADYLIKGIKVEQGRWLADLLIQLSDVALLSKAFRDRINQLDAATKQNIAGQ